MIPRLIYGTAWKKARTAELVEKAVLYGFRGIDTACQPKHYYEPGVGEALQRIKAKGISRESLFIQTKFTPLAGQDLASVPYDRAASLGEQVRQSAQVSLKNLDVDYLDALLLHSPLPRFEETMEVWRAMEKLHAQGIVQRLGLSNCYELHTFQSVYDEAHIKPAFLQNRLYAHTDYDKALRRWCREKNIRYQSFWTLTANPHLLSDPFLLDLASAKGVTVEQLFFRFLSELDIIPLIGTCSEKHMQEDLAIFSIPLTGEEVVQISQKVMI